MVTAATFADKYERDEHGWIIFPRDIEYRRKLFPNKQLEGSVHDVFAHPAKMNLFLVEALVEYLSAPGQWILDPFGGTGSTAMAVRTGRNVVFAEIEPEFQEIIKETASIIAPGGTGLQATPDHWYWYRPKQYDEVGEIALLCGDNRRVLPTTTPVDAVITSPPYSTALNPGSNPLEVHGREGTLATYVRNSNNLGQLNPFNWGRAMRTVWKVTADSMKSGTKLAAVNKDISKSGQRELLSVELIRQAQEAGLQYAEWYKWKPPGTIRQETARNKGGTVIEDEDIIIFVKP